MPNAHAMSQCCWWVSMGLRGDRVVVVGVWCRHNNESEHHNVVPTVVVVSLSVMLVRVCIFVMRMPCEKFSLSLCECMMHDAMIILHDSHMYDHYPCLRRPLDNLAILGFAESAPNTRRRGTRSVREGCHPQRCVERNITCIGCASLPASFFLLHVPFVSPASSSAGSYPLYLLRLLSEVGIFPLPCRPPSPPGWLFFQHC